MTSTTTRKIQKLFVSAAACFWPTVVGAEPLGPLDLVWAYRWYPTKKAAMKVLTPWPPSYMEEAVPAGQVFDFLGVEYISGIGGSDVRTQLEGRPGYYVACSVGEKLKLPPHFKENIPSSSSSSGIIIAPKQEFVGGSPEYLRGGTKIPFLITEAHPLSRLSSLPEELRLRCSVIQMRFTDGVFIQKEIGDPHDFDLPDKAHETSYFLTSSPDLKSASLNALMVAPPTNNRAVIKCQEVQDMVLQQASEETSAVIASLREILSGVKSEGEWAIAKAMRKEFKGKNANETPDLQRQPKRDSDVQLQGLIARDKHRTDRVGGIFDALQDNAYCPAHTDRKEGKKHAPTADGLLCLEWSFTEFVGRRDRLMSLAVGAYLDNMSALRMVVTGKEKNFPDARTYVMRALTPRHWWDAHWLLFVIRSGSWYEKYLMKPLKQCFKCFFSCLPLDWLTHDEPEEPKPKKKEESQLTAAEQNPANVVDKIKLVQRRCDCRQMKRCRPLHRRTRNDDRKTTKTTTTRRRRKIHKLS